MGQLDAEPEPEFGVEVVSEAAGAPIVAVRGELDIATIERLDDAVRPIISGGAPKLILDFSGVSFADSTALAKLVQWNRMTSELELRGASELLRRVITSMGLADTLRLT